MKLRKILTPSAFPHYPQKEGRGVYRLKSFLRGLGGFRRRVYVDPVGQHTPALLRGVQRHTEGRIRKNVHTLPSPSEGQKGGRGGVCQLETVDKTVRTFIRSMQRIYVFLASLYCINGVASHYTLCPHHKATLAGFIMSTSHNSHYVNFPNYSQKD